MTANDLAQLVRGQLEGDAATAIQGVAPLTEASAGQLSFVSPGRAAAKQAEQSQAGCLLVPPQFDNSTHRTIIRVKDPRAAFALAIRTLRPPPPRLTGIHPTAIVDSTATLGEGVGLGPFVTIGARANIGRGCSIAAGTQIGDDVTLGQDSLLHPRVTLYPGITIGARVTVHSGAVIGADGFGFVMQEGRYEKFPQIGTVQIDDDAEIGANCCIDRAALGITRIGEGTKLDNLVHIAHNCQIGKHVVIAAQTGLAGNVTVEDYAVIGGQVGIGDKARIESRAVLGSGCGILTSKIVRSGQVVWGTPARPLREYLERLAVLGRLPELYKEIAANRRKTGQEVEEQPE